MQRYVAGRLAVPVTYIPTGRSYGPRRRSYYRRRPTRRYIRRPIRTPIEDVVFTPGDIRSNQPRISNEEIQTPVIKKRKVSHIRDADLEPKVLF